MADRVISLMLWLAAIGGSGYAMLATRAPPFNWDPDKNVQSKMESRNSALGFQSEDDHGHTVISIHKVELDSAMKSPFVRKEENAISQSKTLISNNASPTSMRTGDILRTARFSEDSHSDFAGVFRSTAITRQ